MQANEKEHVETIITFETYSSTEWQASSDPRRFIPNLYFSLSKEDINQKIKAMECYEFEKGHFPSRSSKALELVAERCGVMVGEELRRTIFNNKDDIKTIE